MPRYFVTVKPGSSQEKIVDTPPSFPVTPDQGTTSIITSGTDSNSLDGRLTIYLRAKPHDGEANSALVNLLAKHFRVPKTSIKISRGSHSRTKLIEF